MEISREELNPCTIQLSIKCAPEQVQTGFDKAYKNYAKRMRIPGFRPGHAPKSVLEPMIDKRDLYNAAAEEIVRSAVNDALKQEKIKPHDTPVVELKSLDENEKTCEFIAKVPLEPKVELGNYKGIEVTRQKAEVTDKEVNAQIDELRRRAGSKESVVDRGIQESDMVTVNLKVEGDEGEGKNFMVVAGQTFKGMDESLGGMKAEEMKMADLSFPKDFHVAEWAGKKKKVQITVRSISSVNMPELNDAFASELKAKDLKDLQKKVSDALLAAKENLNDELMNESIQQALLNSSKVDVPDTMWESVASQRLNEIAREVQAKGQSVEDYAKANGMTVDEMVAKWQAEAKIQVMRAVVANTIFRQEKMQLTNQDVTDTLVAMAREHNADPRALFEFLKKNKMLFEVEVRAVYNKVMAFLRTNAKITEAN